jgi:hypothetical protein
MINAQPVVEREWLHKEKEALRTELVSLKNCQITFLTYTVTGTGLLMGFAVNLVSTDKSPLPMLGIMYLVPLTIILPFWWIFFDKATTITRIVGYYRILEELIIDPKSNVTFLGWENALAKFRDEYGKKSTTPPPPNQERFLVRLFRLIVLQTSQRYWVITYYTFTSLSLIVFFTCFFSLQQSIASYGIAFSLASMLGGFVIGLLKDKWAQITVLICLFVVPPVIIYLLTKTPPLRVSIVLLNIAAFIIGISISRNAVLVLRLSWGEYSYYDNYQVWRRILKVDPIITSPSQVPPTPQPIGNP